MSTGLSLSCTSSQIVGTDRGVTVNSTIFQYQSVCVSKWGGRCVLRSLWHKRAVFHFMKSSRLHKVWRMATLNWNGSSWLIPLRKLLKWVKHWWSNLLEVICATYCVFLQKPRLTHCKTLQIRLWFIHNTLQRLSHTLEGRLQMFRKKIISLFMTDVAVIRKDDGKIKGG